MSSTSEIVVTILLVLAVLAVPVLVVYILYRVGLYVALNFTEYGRSITRDK